MVTRLIALLFAVLMASCGDLDGLFGETEETEDASTATIDTSFTQSGRLALAASLTGDPVNRGVALESQVASLQYYITAIQICQDMDITGTGYSNPQNCLYLYENWSKHDYDSFGAAEARANTEDYIDMVDPTSLQKLAQTVNLTSNHVGSYKYGLVNWNQPIKITAEVTLNDGTVLYTKDGTVSSNGSHYTTSVTGMTTGPATEAIVRHNNGGAWFTFQEPFEITEDDITNGNGFSMTFVFNPDKVVKGYSFASNGSIIDSESNYAISVPLLGITPVVTTGDDLVKKETYLIRNSDELDFDAQLELYYAASDADKTILGVDFNTYFNELSSDSIPGSTQIFSVTTNTDSVTFNSWQGAFINEFVRKSTVGETGTVTFNCAEFLSSSQSDCAAAQTTLTAHYELAAVSDVATENTITPAIDISAILLENINATWTSTCIGVGSTSEKHTIVFNTDYSFKYTKTTYSDTGCSADANNNDHPGTYAFGDPHGAVVGAKQINFTFTGSDGITAGTVVYEIFTINQNELTLGSLAPYVSGTSATAAASRPTALSSYVYTRPAP